MAGSREKACKQHLTRFFNALKLNSTMDENKKIDKEISEINEIIDNWEDTDFIYMERHIRDLRHRIMYVHTRLESTVGILIGVYILAPVKNTISKEIKQLIMTRFDKVVSETDFARKVTLAEELNLIPGSVKNNLFKVNHLRLIFSHPKSHEAEIKEFLIDKNYLEALKILRDSYDEMSKLISELIKKASDRG